MKLLTEYLNNKIKDTKYLDDSFPTRPNYNEILDFLKKQNFKLINYDIGNTLIDVMYDIEHAAKKSKTPLLYVTDEDFLDKASNKKYTWIRLCNYGKISKDNPIFLLRLFRDDDSCCPKIGAGTIEINLSNRIEIETYDEFVKIVNKQFGWE